MTLEPTQLADRISTSIADHSSERGVVGLCFVRLDRLGEINQSIGYESAELLLDEFAERVRSVVRRRDELIEVKRNKLCIVMKNLVDERHAELACAKLERMFTEPIDVIDRRVKVTVHAGLALGAGDDVRDLMLRSELALQRARDGARLTVIAKPEERTAETDDWAFETELAAAIENGELYLDFQPKVSAAYGNVLGAEALMRWQSPKRGLVSPTRFIPVAERRGLIRDITFFALKSGIGQCAAWPETTSVAVNLDATVLADNALLDVVNDSLSIFGVAPSRLVVEITETAFMEHREQASALLTALRGRGVRVSIDDFGTGYSSLAYFRDLPADELKVDRSFVKGMSTQKGDADIVRTIVELGHRFGLTVVAEGVEDEATVTQCRDLGCDVLQGYWIAKPMTGSAFREWLSRRVGR